MLLEMTDLFDVEVGDGDESRLLCCCRNKTAALRKFGVRKDHLELSEVDPSPTSAEAEEVHFSFFESHQSMHKKCGKGN